MQENNINIDKLEKLFNIFVKDVGEEYFDNLQKIYDILQETLLNKEYVENITEEKLDVFVEENKELLRYFEYFEFDDLKSYGEKDYLKEKKYNYELMGRKISMPSGFVDKENYFEQIIHFLTINVNSFFEELEEIYTKIEKLKQSKNNFISDNLEEGMLSPIDEASDDAASFWEEHVASSILLNLIYPKFNNYGSILELFDINDINLEINDDILNEIKTIQNISNIPTGIFFFHFCKWYDEDYIEKIAIKNYFTIKNVELNNFESKEIYLLGENGSGKTILLQSVFSALGGSSFVRIFINKEKFRTKYFPTRNGGHYHQSVYAYGVNRNRITTSREEVEPEFHTLFSNNAELNDPEKWLMKLKLRDNNNNSQINFSVATKMLTNLFEDKIEIKEIEGEILFVEGQNTTNFNGLATGYQTVLIWLIDLIIRMSQKQKYVKELKDFKGTVLIDELDLFLHPKWAYKIMEKLRSWFPRVRFIISTHSPVLILGASKDAILYKVYKNENGKTQVSESITGISNLMANSIITSPLFDMEQAYSRAFDKTKEELRLGDDFIYDKIHDFVAEKIKSKNNVQEKDIMDLIKEKYNQIKATK